jgi:hypothetical protein
MLRCGKTELVTDFLDVVKFTALTPLLLLNLCKLSFPIVGLKIFTLPTLVMKPLNKILI